MNTETNTKPEKDFPPEVKKMFADMLYRYAIWYVPRLYPDGVPAPAEPLAGEAAPALPEAASST